MKSESKFYALEQGQDSFSEYVSLKLLQLAASVSSWGSQECLIFCSNTWHNNNLEAYLCQTSKGRPCEEAKLLGGITHLSLSGTQGSVNASENIPAYP